MTLRFERAEVYEGVQFGVESTPGTLVPANKRLQGLTFNFDHMTEIKPYRPTGFKFNTSSQRGKEMTGGRIEGIQCYNDMVYLASSWITTGTVTTPANNSFFNLSDISGGTFGATYKGSVLAPATFANAAALQTALGNLASIGPGNVLVTGPLTAIVIEMLGPLSTDVSLFTTVTGTATATVTAGATATLTRRWKYLMAPTGPDNVITFSLEKGATGVNNEAQNAAFAFIAGLDFKHTKNEASFTGTLVAQTTTDSVTMTASPTDVPCIPVDPRDTSVYMGTSINNMILMDRILEIDFGVTDRATGLITINKNDKSISNRIEGVPKLTMRFFAEHDSNGKAMLANLRAGSGLYVVLESVGPVIETGFNYRLKWTMYVELLKPNPTSVDGAYGNSYDCEFKYSTVLGTAIQLEIDTPMATL